MISIGLNRVLLALLLVVPLIDGMAQQGAIVPNSGFVVFGRVSLPDGRPATRVKVYLETRGVTRDTLTNDEGTYEFRGLTAGRFRMHAVNPADPTMISDPAESDSTRAYSNRLQIDIYLRLPLHSDSGNRPPGTINVAEVTQSIPKPARQAYEQGLKFQKENQAEKALENFSRAIEIYPGYFQAFTERGNLLMQHNNLSEALTDFDRALELNSRYSPALRGAGYCNIQQRNYELAIDQLNRSIAIEPKVSLTHMLLGYANLSLNRYREAKEYLQRALKLDPDKSARARVYLAEVFAHEEKFREAADEINTYLKLRPQASDAADLRKRESNWREQSKAVKKP